MYNVLEYTLRSTEHCEPVNNQKPSMCTCVDVFEGDNEICSLFLSFFLPLLSLSLSNLLSLDFDNEIRNQYRQSVHVHVHTFEFYFSNLVSQKIHRLIFSRDKSNPAPPSHRDLIFMSLARNSNAYIRSSIEISAHSSIGEFHHCWIVCCIPLDRI